MKKLSDLFEEAADIIEKQGWIQGSFEDNLGGKSVCMWCAINQAQCGNNHHWNRSDSPTQQQVTDVLKKIIPIDPPISLIHSLLSSIAIWNDDPSRTKQEVLDVLRKAAKLSCNAPGEASGKGDDSNDC